MKLNRQKADGFTIIELLVTMSIAAILLAIGVPSFQTMVQNRRIEISQLTLETDLEMARSEAMTRNQPVVLCRHNGETATPTACSTTANWQDGWVIFIDTNGDDKVDTDELLRVTPSLGAGLTFAYNKPKITFTSRGFASGSNGTFMICDDRGNQYGYNLVVSNTGFSHVEAATGC
ncbi:MAG: GspH/FimT family pseudopilin [Methylococcales bacterium]